MKTNPLKKLESLGQSIWIDYIKRDMFTNGQLAKLRTEDDVRGMTSNPSIFEKSIVESTDYQSDIQKMSQEKKDVNEIYEALTQKDVQDAADEFRDLYDQTDGRDGYVSLEVNPHLAHDTDGTIEEARRLWKALNRPNVFIKVPATKEGLPAIKKLISEGINVNVTLIFSVERYTDVAKAYIQGIEARIAQDKPVSHVASVASFFISRIDALVDPLLEKKIKEHSEDAKTLQGQVAIETAQIAYQIFEKLFKSPHFKTLESKGARVQRVLWASTSTKNPAYSDVKYVEALIAPDTVNTLPLETLEAYRDHGDPMVRLNNDANTTPDLFHRLEKLGINIDKVNQQLEDEGVDKFIKSYDQLIATLKKNT
jgi:transaldolase